LQYQKEIFQFASNKVFKHTCAKEIVVDYVHTAISVQTVVLACDLIESYRSKRLEVDVFV
jgi:hypothetical protein